MSDDKRRLNDADIAYVRGILRKKWVRAAFSADEDAVTNLLRFYRHAGYSRRQVVEAAKQSHNWTSFRSEMTIVGPPEFEVF